MRPDRASGIAPCLIPLLLVAGSCAHAPAGAPVGPASLPRGAAAAVADLDLRVAALDGGRLPCPAGIASVFEPVCSGAGPEREVAGGQGGHLSVPLAEALLLARLAMPAAPEEMAEAARVAVDVAERDCRGDRREPRCGMLAGYARAIAEEAAFRTSFASRCGRADGGATAWTAACLREANRHWNECLAPPAGLDSPGAATAWLRQVTLCAATVFPVVGDGDLLSLRSRLGYFASLSGPLAPVHPATRDPEMYEVRLRAALLAFVGARDDLALAWLAYRLSDDSRPVKQWLLFHMLSRTQTVAPEELEREGARLLARGSDLTRAARTVPLELVSDAVVERSTEMVAGWISRSSPGAVTAAAIRRPDGGFLGPMWEHMGPALERAGAFDLAEVVYRRHAADPPRLLPSGERDLRPAFELGMFLYRRGRFRDAADVLAAVSASPRFGRLGGFVADPETRRPRRDLASGSLDTLPSALQANQCAPFSLHQLFRYWRVHEFMGLDGVDRLVSRYGSGPEPGTPPSRMLSVPPMLGWRLWTVSDGADMLAVTKSAIDAGFPLLAVLKASQCEGPQPRFILMHATLITGYDDALGALLIVDLNWAKGIGQLSYADVAPERLLLLVPVPPGRQVPPVLEGAVEEVSIDAGLARLEVLARLPPVCMD